MCDRLKLLLLGIAKVPKKLVHTALSTPTANPPQHLGQIKSVQDLKWRHSPACTPPLVDLIHVHFPDFLAHEVPV